MKFELGTMVFTSGVKGRIDEGRFAGFVGESLKRHTNCDWGDVCQEDKNANDLALKEGTRLFSAYESREFPKIWIITEADRSATTVLFPEEY